MTQHEQLAGQCPFFEQPPDARTLLFSQLPGAGVSMPVGEGLRDGFNTRIPRFRDFGQVGGSAPLFDVQEVSL
jgi:hypothetical protein